MEEKDLVLFPVAGWEIATIPHIGALFIRLAFLSHQFQKIEEADPGRRYVFQAAQARELRDAIDRALQTLESGGPQGAGEPKH